MKTIILIFILMLYNLSWAESNLRAQWIPLSQLSQTWAERLIQSQNLKFNQNLNVLVSEVEYILSQDIKLFNPDYFLNTLNLSELSGTTFRSTTNPFIFQSSFSPYPNKTVTSYIQIQFPKNFSILEEILRIPLDPKSHFAVVQTGYGFSDYLECTILITLFHSIEPGKTQVKLYSLGLLKNKLNDSWTLHFIQSGMMSKLKKQVHKSWNYFENSR